MRYIGDVHGKYSQYRELIRNIPASIQVGDMGVGFIAAVRDDVRYLSNPPHYAMRQGNHRFIRGNHDNPGVCQRHSQWIADGTVEGDTMFIGGALSVDRASRTEGYSWWADEELSTVALNNLVDKYIETKPRVMITHDCPEEVAEEMERMFCRDKINDPSRTRQALQSMWSAHSPELWLFGHWHNSFRQVLRGTTFICLAELEVLDI